MAEEAKTEGAGSAPAADDYECKICYNDFDLDLHRPKVLGCAHTFCRGCLEALHRREGRGWRLGCPVCRHRTRVPDYRVHNLSDHVALVEALPLRRCEPPAPDDGRHAGAPPPPASPAEDGSEPGCRACKQAAFTAGCVCAVVSLLSTGVLLLLGLVFVHNFNEGGSQVGPVCLFVSSLLALFSIVLTWLLCLLRFRPEAGDSSFTSLR